MPIRTRPKMRHYRLPLVWLFNKNLLINFFFLTITQYFGMYRSDGCRWPVKWNRWRRRSVTDPSFTGPWLLMISDDRPIFCCPGPYPIREHVGSFLRRISLQRVHNYYRILGSDAPFVRLRAIQSWPKLHRAYWQVVTPENCYTRCKSYN